MDGIDQYRVSVTDVAAGAPPTLVGFPHRNEIPWHGDRQRDLGREGLEADAIEIRLA